MRKKDILIGLIVVVAVVVGILWLRKSRNSDDLKVVTSQVEDQIEKTFNGLVIPDDVEKTELKDVSGGTGVGIATRDMVLADLPDPKDGYFYQVWVEDGKTLTSLGKMRVAKGGFLFEGKVDGSKMVVSEEKVFDGKIESRILEGSF